LKENTRIAERFTDLRVTEGREVLTNFLTTHCAWDLRVRNEWCMRY